MIRLLLTLLVLLVSYGCNSPEQVRDIPFSETDTHETIRNKGSRAHAQQVNAWNKRMREEGSPEHCEPGDDHWALKFLKQERASREKEGGADCRCIPMGESCLPNTCTCKEICPNDHGILRGRANQMNPKKKNNLAFENDTSYNGTAYKKYPNVDGYCAGNNAVLRKLQVLSDMRPELRSWPAMKKGSPEWRAHTLEQIRRFGLGEDPEFLGVADMTDLMKDPEFLEAMKKSSGYSFGIGDASATDKSFWTRMATARDAPQPKFSHPGTDSIPAKTAMDPDTGKAVPPEGGKEYHAYIQDKVKRIMSGAPASLPGYSSIHALSSDPTYMEMIGAQVAIDWQAFGNMEDEKGFHGYSSGEDDGDNKPHEPMDKEQLKTFAVQARAYLPLMPDSYPKGKKPGDSWNESGPYQTMSISIRSSIPNGTAKPAHGYHSIEAWAYRNMPNGILRVCIHDPNNAAGADDHCDTYMDVDQNDPSKTIYTNFPGRTIGKFNFSASSTGHSGNMTEKLVAYCRRVKAQSFRGGPCAD